MNVIFSSSDEPMNGLRAVHELLYYGVCRKLGVDLYYARHT